MNLENDRSAKEKSGSCRKKGNLGIGQQSNTLKQNNIYIQITCESKLNNLL